MLLSFMVGQITAPHAPVIQSTPRRITGHASVAQRPQDVRRKARGDRPSQTMHGRMVAMVMAIGCGVSKRELHDKSPEPNANGTAYVIAVLKRFGIVEYDTAQKLWVVVEKYD